MPNEELKALYNKKYLKKSEPSSTTGETSTASKSMSAMDVMNRQSQMTEKDLIFRDIPEDFKSSLTFGNEVNSEDYEPLNDIFKNALFGEYTSALKANKNTTGFVVKKWGELESTAKELYDHVKTQSGKRFITKEQVDAYNQKTSDLRNKFNNLRYDAENSLKLNEKGEARPSVLMHFDEDTDYSLMNNEEYKVVNTKPVIRQFENPNESATDMQFQTKTWRGYGWLVGNEDPVYQVTDGVDAYKQFRVNEDTAGNNLNSELRPILKQWVSGSFDLLNKPVDDDPKNSWGNKDINANKESLLQLADQIVGLGTKSGNADIVKSARSIMIGMYRAQAMNPNDQKNATLNYIKGKRDDLEKITNSLTSTGSSNIYETFKDNFKRADYWMGIEEWGEADNVINKLIRVRGESLDASQKYRSAVIETMGNDVKSEISRSLSEANNETQKAPAYLKQYIFENMFTNRNTFKSLDALKKSLYNKYGSYKTVGYTERLQVVGGSTMAYSPQEYQESKGVTFVRNPYTYKGNGREAEGFSPEDVERVYKELRVQFKKQFAKKEVSSAMKQSGMVYGMNFNKSQFIGWDSVDMSSDNSKTDTYKAVTAMVENNLNIDKNIGNNLVFVKEGGYKPTETINQITKDKSGSTRTANSQKKIFDDFFKNLKSNKAGQKLFDVDYSPVSNLENKALYIFRAKPEGSEKWKQISVYVDKSLPELQRDELYKGALTHPADWSFNLDGEWSLNHLRNEAVKKGTDLKIVLDKKTNMKYLQGEVYNSDLQNYVKIKHPLTTVNMSRIEDNERQVQDFLNTLAKQM
jgi:hypothetical protein